MLLRVQEDTELLNGGFAILFFIVILFWPKSFLKVVRVPLFSFIYKLASGLGINQTMKAPLSSLLETSQIILSSMTDHILLYLSWYFTLMLPLMCVMEQYHGQRSPAAGLFLACKHMCIIIKCCFPLSVSFMLCAYIHTFLFMF